MSADLVLGLVLAAGRSTRMGRPKALLPDAAGRSFVASIVRTLRAAGLTDVVVVGRSEDYPLQNEITAVDPGVQYLPNPHADRGQLSSVHAGIGQARTIGASALLVLPVDTPLVRPDTVAAVLAASSAARIVRAVYQGRHGHPVAFGRNFFSGLLAADPAVGARSILHAHPQSVLNLEVDDPGVLVDVDTPEDYRVAFGGGPGGDRSS